MARQVRGGRPELVRERGHGERQRLHPARDGVQLVDQGGLVEPVALLGVARRGITAVDFLAFAPARLPGGSGVFFGVVRRMARKALRLSVRRFGGSPI